MILIISTPTDEDSQPVNYNHSSESQPARPHKGRTFPGEIWAGPVSNLNKINLQLESRLRADRHPHIAHTVGYREEMIAGTK